MGKYYIKSIIGGIADGIKRLINDGVIIKDESILIYGLDRNSFAIRTIMSNLGFNNIEGYVSDDEDAVIGFKQDIENFSCKFLNDRKALINVSTINERLKSFDDSVRILIASKGYADVKNSLERLGYKEKIHFYRVYDFDFSEVDDVLKTGKEMTSEMIKAAEKDALVYIDDLCQKMGLKYWVCGGTLIGTMRHKGFIPWDDDVDIFMPWDDYHKLVGGFKETDKYVMMGFGTSKNNNDFPDHFAKFGDKRYFIREDLGTVLRVFPIGLDIFPIMGLPSDDDERNLLFSKYRELNRSMWQDFYAHNGDVTVFKKYYDKQIEIMTTCDYETSEYVGVLGSQYGAKDYCSKAAYDETLRCPFEDIEVNVPVGYDENLTNLHGSNWNKLPDKSKRKSHHNFDAYDMGNYEAYNKIFK